MKRYRNNHSIRIHSMVISILAAVSISALAGTATGCSGDTFQKYKLDRIVDEVPPEPDTTAPAVESVKVAAYNKLSVTFDQEVDPKTAVDASNYHIQGVNRVEVLLSPAPVLASDGKTVTLSLSQGYLYGMQHGKDYTLLVQKVKDLNANAILTDFATFTGKGQVFASVSYNGSDMPVEYPWPSISSASPVFTIGGDGVVSYMYSFDDSAWCSEIRLTDNAAIPFSSLSEGFHTLKVIGKNSDGKWQDVNESTNVSFTVDTIAPIAALSHVPLSVTTSGSCTIDVGGEGVTYYEYKFNSESWSGKVLSTTAVTRKNLVPGNYVLYVRGYDDAGNMQSGTTSYSWQIVENQPVALLKGLPEKNSRMTTIGITVSGVDVNYYTYSLNGTSFGMCNVSDPITISGLQEGTYTLAVTGLRTSDLSTAGPEIGYTWTVDKTASVCTISNTPMSPTSSQSTHIFVSSAEGDIVSYQYYLTTGSRKGELRGPFLVSVPIDLTNLPENTYTLQVMGIDAAGNVQSELNATQYSWSVDISAPTAVLNGLPSTLTSTTGFSVSVSSAANDIVAYKYMLDDGSGTAQWSSEIDASVPVARTSMADGTYTLCVIGRDGSGNWQSMQADTEYTWTIDTAPPVALLGNTPAKLTSSTEAHFTVYGNQVISFQYRIDGGAWSELKSRISSQGTVTTIDYAGLVEGTHTLEVVAVDLAGNRQSSSPSSVTSYSWQINTSLPSATLSGTPANYTNDTSISVIVSNCETYKYMIDNGAWKGPFPISDPISETGFGEGTHTLSVIGQKTIGGNIVSQDSIHSTTLGWVVDLSAPTATIAGVNPMQTAWTSASSITVGTSNASFTIAGNGVYSYKIAHLTEADDGNGDLSYYPSSGYSSEIVLTSDAASHQVSFSNLANGRHRIYVIARDEAGNWQPLNEATRYFWTINTASPVVALSAVPSPTQLKETSVIVSGTSELVSYSYSLDGSAWSAETGIGTPIAVKNLADGWHHLYVIGKNSLGVWQDIASASKVNSGVDSNGDPIDGWYVDTTAPDLSCFNFVFSSLPSNPTTATTASGIKVQAVTDGAGGASVAAIKYRLVTGGVAGDWSAELAIDSSTLIATLPTLPSSGVFSANEYAIDVMARDTLGNWTTSCKRSDSWKVISGADLPLAVIGTGSLKNPSRNTNPSFTVSGMNINQYQYSKDGTNWSSWTPISSNTISLSFSSTGSDDGMKTLLVRGSKSTTVPPPAAELDNTAMTQTAAQATKISWMLDTQAPTVVLSNAPADGTNTSFSVNVGGDGVVSYQYQIDGGNWEPVVGGSLADRTVDYPIAKTLAAGTHTLNVKGFDQAGNDSDIAAHTWTIMVPDLVPPTVSAKGINTVGNVGFEWTNPDGSASVYIQISASSDFSTTYARLLLGNVGSYEFTPSDADIDTYYARVWVSRTSKTALEASGGTGWYVNTVTPKNSRPSDSSFKGPGTGSGGVKVVGHITGKVVDPTTTTGVSGAIVQIYDQKASGYLTDKQVTTSSTGTFTISNVPIRTMTGNTPYRLDVSKSGYCSSRKNNVTVARGETTNVGTIYIMDTTGKSKGKIGGTVVDANTAYTLESSVSIIDGNGVEVSTATSESAFGTFITGAELNPGIYSVKITKTGYYDMVKDNVVVNGNKNIGRQPICSMMTEPQVRVVYQWDGYPSDPDMYMTGPTMITQTDTPANRFRVWSGDKSFYEKDGQYYDGDIEGHGDWYGDHSTASLVQDAVTGWGPEAINLYRCGGVQYAKGTYTFTIQRYAYNPARTSFTTSSFFIAGAKTASGNTTVTGTVPNKTLRYYPDGNSYPYSIPTGKTFNATAGTNIIKLTASLNTLYYLYNYGVEGTGIPSGTSYIIWYDRTGTTPFQINNTVTQTTTGGTSTLTFYNRIEAYGLFNGVPVTGAGIPDGTTVVSAKSTGAVASREYEIVLSNAPTSSVDPNTLTFKPGWGSSTGRMLVYDSGGLVKPIDFPSEMLTSDSNCWKALKINVQGNMRSKRKITAVNEFATFSQASDAGISKTDADW